MGRLGGLIVEFDIARKEKRKKAEQDEDGRKKRKLEDEIAVETNGDDDGDTEIEKVSEEGDSADDRDEQEDEQFADGKLASEDLPATQPDDGSGARRAMQVAMRDAGLSAIVPPSLALAWLS